jgi:hypothetical protein
MTRKKKAPEPEPDDDEEEEEREYVRHDPTKRGPRASPKEEKEALAKLDAGKVDLKGLRKVVDGLSNWRDRQILHFMLDDYARTSSSERSAERRKAKRELDIWD